MAETVYTAIIIGKSAHVMHEPKASAFYVPRPLLQLLSALPH